MYLRFVVGLVAATMATGALAADAKGSLYGELRLSATHIDSTGAVTQDQDIGDNGSFFGLKASVAEGGITAFARYERAVDTDDGANPATGVGSSSTSTLTGGKDQTREALVGATSDRFGTLVYGQAETAYSRAARRFDPFYNTGLADLSGQMTIGAPAANRIGIGSSHGGSLLSYPIHTAAYVNNTLSYTTPSFANVTGNIAVYADEDAGGAQDHDYGLGIELNSGGLTAGFQNLDMNSGVSAGSTSPNFLLNGVEAWLVYAGIDRPGWGAGVAAEKLDGPGLASSSAESVLASAWFALSAKTRLAAVGGYTHNVAEGTSFGIGAFHDMGANLTVYAGGRTFDGGAGNADAYAVAVGANYRFAFPLAP